VKALFPIFLCLILTGAGVGSEINNSRIMITVAHISEDSFSRYKLIHKDVQKDIAVYINEKYQPNVIAIGSIVTFEDEVAEVIKNDGDYFYIDVKNKHVIRRGLSGIKVLYKNKAIGFISSLETTGYLRCVYY
jgi:hypothetical protein